MLYTYNPFKLDIKNKKLIDDSLKDEAKVKQIKE